MKFAKTIREHAVPEWWDQYMAYKNLKKRISAVEDTDTAEKDEESKVAIGDGKQEKLLDELFDALAQESQKVDEFLLEQLSTFRKYVLSVENGLRGVRVGVSPETGEEIVVSTEMTKALEETYRGLSILDNYVLLNRTGFRKILKKLRKVLRPTRCWVEASGRAAQFEEDLKSTPLETTNGVRLLKDKVEALYIEKCALGNRSKGMHRLRSSFDQPSVPKDATADSFAAGLFLGLAFGVLILGVGIAHTPTVTSHTRASFEAMLLPCHCLLFSALPFLWTRYHVNYRFILDVPTSHHFVTSRVLFVGALGLFAWATCLYLALALDLGQHSSSGATSGVWEWWAWKYLPGFSVLFIVGVASIVYMNAGLMLIKAMLAPLFGVHFADVFFTDQLVSLADPVVFAFHIPRSYSAWPQLIRFLQCARLYHSTRARPHILNMIKYALGGFTILFARTAMHDGHIWAWLLAVIATLYAFVWDTLVDWGLRTHRELWLSYTVPIFLNFVMRFAFLGGLAKLPGDVWVVVAYDALEVVRRCMWSYFRVANQHLDNCERYRVIADIPTIVESSQPLAPPRALSRMSFRVQPGSKPQKPILPHVTLGRLREGLMDLPVVKRLVNDLHDDESDDDDAATEAAEEGSSRASNRARNGKYRVGATVVPHNGSDSSRAVSPQDGADPTSPTHAPEVKYQADTVQPFVSSLEVATESNIDSRL